MGDDVVGESDGMERSPPDGVTDFVDSRSVADAFESDQGTLVVFKGDPVGTRRE